MKQSHVRGRVVRSCDEKSDSQVHVCINAEHSDGLMRLGLGGERARGSPSGVVLSQKHPLQAVGRHAALVLRLCVALGVGAAGRGALRRAQVVHEGQPVLSTEVHKLNLAHA